jgi:uncharacterized membrane protein
MAWNIPLLLKHLWLDADDARRWVPEDVLSRLTTQVSASERRHSGEIRICIEASLPWSYLRRINEETSLNDVIRARAVAMFAELGVWDTAQNNGVLIYLLLAEHAIEVVADRGLNAHVNEQRWHELVGHMEDAFRTRRYQEGLSHAVAEATEVLTLHFPLPEGGVTVNLDELPNAPVVM